MKNRLLLCVLVVLMSIVGCAHAPTMTASVPEQGKSETVALVIKINGVTSMPGCTGVWVNEDTIVTARHCVEGSYTASWWLSMTPMQRFEYREEHDGMPEFTDRDMKGFTMLYAVEEQTDDIMLGEPVAKPYQARAVAMDKSKDLAILVAGKDHPAHTSATLALTLPRVGDDVIVVGHPKGLYWTVVHASFAASRSDVAEVDTLGPFVHLVGPIFPGNSGGGAFDSKGRLIGIASFLYRAPNNCMFIHPVTIRAYLDDNHVGYAAAY